MPGSLITYTGGLSQWVTDFKAAYASDTTLRATMVLDDGVTASVAVELTGADAGSTTAAQIAVTVISLSSTNIMVELTGADAGSMTAAQVNVTVEAATVEPTPTPTPDLGEIDLELVYDSLACQAVRAALDDIMLNLDVREFLRGATMPLDNLRHELYVRHEMPNSEGLGEVFERYVHEHRFEYFSDRNRPAILDRLAEDLGFIYLPFNDNAVAGPTNQDSAWVLTGQTFTLQGATGQVSGTRRIGLELCISPPPNQTAEFIGPDPPLGGMGHPLLQ